MPKGFIKETLRVHDEELDALLWCDRCCAAFRYAVLKEPFALSYADPDDGYGPRSLAQRAENIAMYVASTDDGRYGHISSLADRGWAMLDDPDIGQQIETPAQLALVAPYYEEIFEYIDKWGTE